MSDRKSPQEQEELSHEAYIKEHYTGFSYPNSIYGIARYLAPGGKLNPKTDPLQYRDVEEYDLLFSNSKGDETSKSDGKNPVEITFGNSYDDNFFLIWPPNVFALTSSFFKVTGAFTALLSGEFGRFGVAGGYEEWVDDIDEMATQWRKGLENNLNRKFIELVLPRIPRTNFMDLQHNGSSPEEDGHNPTTTYSFDLMREQLDLIWKDLGKDDDRSPFRGKAPDWTPFLKHDSFKEDLNKLVNKILKGNRLKTFYWDEIREQIDPPRKGNCNDVWRRTKSDDNFLFKLWTIHAVADRASMGWGVRAKETKSEGASRNDLEMKKGDDSPKSQTLEGLCERKTLFNSFVDSLLHRTGNLSFISNDRARILPKRHTPSVGATLRATSSFLSFHDSPMRVKWRTDGIRLIEYENNEENSDSADAQSSDQNPKNSYGIQIDNFKRTPDRGVSILLTPYPFKISAHDFVTNKSSKTGGLAHGRNNLFAFEPEQEDPKVRTMSDGKLREVFPWLQGMLIKAKDESGFYPSMVVLPECALHEKHCDAFENSLKEFRIKSYITGMRSGSILENREDEENSENKNKDDSRPRNYLRFGFLNEKEGRYEYEEYDKQHRWKLDGRQIVQYDLGGRLNPSQDYWEGAEPGERKALFINMGDELTVCPIICEDLARQEALTEMIRSVGPSLVVALLMDGPQLENRWSAKYAGVFGEDPGSATLALTCSGLVKRSNANKKHRSNNIALWCGYGGEITEISLEPGSEAVLLNLAAERVDTSTIDGRSDHKSTYSLRYGGATQILATVPLSPSKTTINHHYHTTSANRQSLSPNAPKSKTKRVR